MILLETERLKIYPLTAQQLKLYLLNDGSLEKELGLEFLPKKISSELSDTLQKYFLPLVARHYEHYYYYTLWAIVLKAENRMVADLCFKGIPTEEGQVEIGYGTYATHRGNGIMTEAVKRLIAWCQARPDITLLLAETEVGNSASEKILKKNSFKRYHRGQDSSWWELKVK